MPMRDLATRLDPEAPTMPKHVAGAMAIAFAAHPKEQLPDITIALWGKAFADTSQPLLTAAVFETIQRVKWFPKVQEVQEAVSMIERLITGRGMYDTSKEGRERFRKVIEWRNTAHEATLAFIAAQKNGDREPVVLGRLHAPARRDTITSTDGVK